MSAWILLSMVASALGSAGQQPELAPARAVTEVYVDVGGRAVRALCTDGPRRVLFLHGADLGADAWRPVLERLGPGAGGCAYDREPPSAVATSPGRSGAGFAGRGPGRGPVTEDGSAVGGAVPALERRGWFELLEVLREVHAALGFDRPTVMVGHGIGGMYARLLAADRPGDVAGLVLVEPTTRIFRRSCSRPCPGPNGRPGWSAVPAPTPMASGRRPSPIGPDGPDCRTSR